MEIVVQVNVAVNSCMELDLGPWLKIVDVKNFPKMHVVSIVISKPIFIFLAFVSVSDPLMVDH